MSEKIKAKNCVSIDVYLPTVLPTFLLRLLLFRLLIQFFCSNYTFFLQISLRNLFFRKTTVNKSAQYRCNNNNDSKIND